MSRNASYSLRYRVQELINWTTCDHNTAATRIISNLIGPFLALLLCNSAMYVGVGTPFVLSLSPYARLHPSLPQVCPNSCTGRRERFCRYSSFVTGTADGIAIQEVSCFVGRYSTFGHCCCIIAAALILPSPNEQVASRPFEPHDPKFRVHSQAKYRLDARIFSLLLPAPFSNALIE
jgi:hypothetical protein